MQILSLNRDQAGCLWFWKTRTSDLGKMHFIYSLICLKIHVKRNQPNIFTPCLRHWTQYHIWTDSKGQQKRGAGETSRWLFSTWPQEVRRKGHLPGYVSVTSKKEERRDTWSESDKSVRQHIHTVRRKGVFTCRVLEGGRLCALKSNYEFSKLLLQSLTT